MKHALFICFILICISSCSSETTTTSGTLSWWCGQTPYPERCEYYVITHHNISATQPLSMTEFLDTIVRVAIEHGGEVLKLAQGFEADYPNAPGKSLWSSCVDYFDEVVFTLNQTVDETLVPTPFDVQTWITASLAFIDACERGFEFINITNTNVSTISTNLTELTVNSLAISVLVNDSETPGVVDWDLGYGYKLSDLGSEPPNVVVAKDGSGNFTKVQEAVNAGRQRTWPGRYVIYVKAGVYNEQVVIPRTSKFIKIYGDGINQTIITGSRSAGGTTLTTPLAGDLKATSTFQVWGRGFIAHDITFRNTAGPQGMQAVALLSASDQAAFYHCSIEGYQDSLFAFSNRQFYKECQLLGTVDFVFGDGLVVFQDCEILFRRPPPGGGLVVAAQGRKYHNERSGFSFQGCKVTAAEDLSGSSKAFLGRPWRQDAVTVFMESFLDKWIDPQGWLDSWGHREATFCSEYKNYGPGSPTSQRVKWSHEITDPNVADGYTVAGFMSGDQWLRKTGVPFTPGMERN